MKKTLKTILLGILCFIFFNSGKHPMHVSTAELIFSDVNNEWRLIKNIFTEDIEHALSKMNGNMVKLEDINSKNQEILKLYIISKIKIQNKNGKLIDYDIYPFQYSRESVDIEIRFKSKKTFRIQDEFLFELFKDHRNIYAIRKNPKNGFSQHEMTNINSTIFMIQ